MLTENRRAKRQWINAPAVLAKPDGKIVSACRTVDVSETGAKLRLLKAIRVSGSVVVVLSGDGSVRRSGTIVWQAGRDAGIQFDQRYDAFKSGPVSGRDLARKKT